MTALERQMAADAVALSKEHADRADAAEACWAELRDEIQRLRDAAYDVATSLCDEGRTISAERAFGKTDALDQVLALMAHTSDEKG